MLLECVSGWITGRPGQVLTVEALRFRDQSYIAATWCYYLVLLQAVGCPCSVSVNVNGWKTDVGARTSLPLTERSSHGGVSVSSLCDSGVGHSSGGICLSLFRESLH